MERQTENARESYTNAFRVVSGIFMEAKEVPLEIEILRNGSTELAQDENCVGVPRKMLFAAMSYVLSSKSTIQGAGITRLLSPEESSILLLANPEHLTAANQRKRVICDLTQNADRTLLQHAVREELWLLDTLLTSPLYRHAKSPTLWSHRRWLMTNYLKEVIQDRKVSAARRRPLEESSEHQAAQNTIMNCELDVIFRAGSQHPKNYPAWDYARTLMKFLETKRLPRHEEVNRSAVLQKTHHWCINHPTDTSGWSFLCTLFSHPGSPLDGNAELLRSILNVTLAFRWSSEAVWSLLRVAIASDMCIPPTCRTGLIRTLNKGLNELRVSPISRSDSVEPSVAAESTKLLMQRIEQALLWIRTNSTT